MSVTKIPNRSGIGEPGLSSSALDVIRSVLEAANHSPDPEVALRNAARATTILGKMLEDMSDKLPKQASTVAKLITRFGLIGYGLLEISVPRSFWFHLGRYWLNLATLIATAMFTLGLIFKSQGAWQLGLIMLLLVWLVSGLRDVLSWFIRRKPAPPVALVVQLPLAILLVCLSILVVTDAQQIDGALTSLGRFLISAQTRVRSIANFGR
jgi:hypothetical protein